MLEGLRFTSTPHQPTLLQSCLTPPHSQLLLPICMLPHSSVHNSCDQLTSIVLPPPAPALPTSPSRSFPRPLVPLLLPSATPLQQCQWRHLWLLLQIPHKLHCPYFCALAALCSDASAANYGRFFNPHENFTYLRRVDYVSAACVMVRRALFLNISGFDLAYGKVGPPHGFTVAAVPVQG